MRNILNKIVFWIYKKCEKYMMDHDLSIIIHPIDLDYDFWGATDD